MDRVRVEPATSWLRVRNSTNWTTATVVGTVLVVCYNNWKTYIYYNTASMVFLLWVSILTMLVASEWMYFSDTRTKSLLVIVFGHFLILYIIKLTESLNLDVMDLSHFYFVIITRRKRTTIHRNSLHIFCTPPISTKSTLITLIFTASRMCIARTMQWQDVCPSAVTRR